MLLSIKLIIIKKIYLLKKLLRNEQKDLLNFINRIIQCVEKNDLTNYKYSRMFKNGTFDAKIIFEVILTLVFIALIRRIVL